VVRSRVASERALQLDTVDVRELDVEEDQDRIGRCPTRVLALAEGVVERLGSVADHVEVVNTAPRQGALGERFVVRVVLDEEDRPPRFHEET
jgi:hypothetical protein